MVAHFSTPTSLQKCHCCPNMHRLRVENGSGFWSPRVQTLLPDLGGTEGHKSGKSRRKYYETKAKCDPPGQKIATPMKCTLLSIAGRPPQTAHLLPCSGQESDPKTLWRPWGVSAEKNQEIKLERNLVELSQMPGKKSIPDMCLKKFSLVCFSYSIRPYYRSLTVSSFSSFCSVRVKKRRPLTLYCKPAVLCDLSGDSTSLGGQLAICKILYMCFPHSDHQHTCIQRYTLVVY